VRARVSLLCLPRAHYKNTHLPCYALASTHAQRTHITHTKSIHPRITPNPPGFGVPNRRKRVFMVASMHGDARDVLLAQVGAFGVLRLREEVNSD
jgi:hypothetical protein